MHAFLGLIHALTHDFFCKKTHFNPFGAFRRQTAQQNPAAAINKYRLTENYPKLPTIKLPEHRSRRRKSRFSKTAVSILTADYLNKKTPARGEKTARLTRKKAKKKIVRKNQTISFKTLSPIKTL